MGETFAGFVCPHKPNPVLGVASHPHPLAGFLFLMIMGKGKKLYGITYRIKIESTNTHNGSALYDGHTPFEAIARLIDDLKNQSESCGFTIESVTDINAEVVKFL